MDDINNEIQMKKDEADALEIYRKIIRWIERNGYSDNVKKRFLYICGEHSEMKIEFDDLLNQFKKLRRQTRDRRVKFTKSEKQRIRKVFKTEGMYSVTKTRKILHNEDIDMYQWYFPIGFK